jgi:hypothetical protein
MKKFLIACCLAGLCGLAAAQMAPAPRKEPLSPALLEHFYKQIHDWDRPRTGPAGASVIAEMEFRTKTRQQLQQAGTAAFPIAPRVAELMAGSQKNRYTIAYIVMGMSPTPTAAELPAVLQAAAGGGAERLVAYAQLGRAGTAEALEVLREGARADDAPVRLMATVALGYLGASLGNDAARALAANLQDQERDVRSASANGLRLIGRAAVVVAPQVIEYLRTGDNPSMAARILRVFPTDVLQPAKGDLEAVVANPKLTTFQKQDAVDILLRLEAEKNRGPATPLPSPPARNPGTAI